MFRSFIHKIKRIFPMVTIACIFTLIIKTIIKWGTTTELLELWNIKTLVANFFLLFAGYPFFSMMGYNNPTWYLAILVQYYIVFYLLKYICDKLHMKLLLIVSAVIVGVIILNKIGVLNTFSFRGFESFYIGIVLCKLMQMYDERDNKNWFLSNRRLLTILLSAVVLVSLGAIVFLPKFQRIILVFGVSPELIVIAYITKDISIKSKIISISRTLCAVSFEVYIWHYPFMALIQLVAQKTNIIVDHSYLTMLIFTISVWILCYPKYRFIEQPINKLIKTKEKAKHNNEQKLSDNRS